MLACRVVCYSRQSDRRIRVCISHQSDFRIRVCISHQSDIRIRVCISHQSDFRIRICISQQWYHSIPMSCTNHSVWVLFLSYFFFVALCEIVFDWYAMLRGVFIEHWFFCERWLTFLLGDLVAVNFRSLDNCKCIARWILRHYLLLREIFWAVSRVILRILDQWKCFQCL